MHKQYHLQEYPMPEGFRIYRDRVPVMGVPMRKADAAAFCKGSMKQVTFLREPDNQYDPNAIRIIGSWKGWFSRKERMLGYVPAEDAAELTRLGLAESVRPRLMKTYVDADGFVEIEIQIIGPADRFSDYKPMTEFESAKAAFAGGDSGPVIAALMNMIEATEADSRANKWGVAPAPYLKLAKIYRKLRMLDEEVSILERYDQQKKAPGVTPAELAERLHKARILRDKSKPPA